MSTGIRLIIAALLVATIGVPSGAEGGQGRPVPSGDPVPVPAPAPKPEPEPPPEGSPPPEEPPPEEPAPDEPPLREVVQVVGHERLAWNQVAVSREELAALRYIVYVDAEPREITGVRCASESVPDGFECSAALPSMADGQHTIEVTSLIDRDGVLLESFRSSPILVRLGASDVDTSRASASVSASVAPAIGGAGLQAMEVVSGLEDPTDIVALPDGRILVAERAGRVRMVRDGALLSAPAVSLTDVITGDGHGLLSMAADRAFDETGHVYVLFSTPSGLALARFTVAGDVLVDRAVLLDGLPISDVQPSASIRMGPDGKLYVGLDSRGNLESAGDLGSYSGKVLRLNTDGTTPSDQPGHSPVFGAGLDSPVGLAWSGDRSMLWIAGRDGSSRDRLDALATDPSANLSARLRFTLPPGTGPSAIVFYEHEASPDLQGSLLVGAAQANGVLRIGFDEAGLVAGTEWLLQDELGPVRALAVGADGAIYAVNGHALLRISAPEM